MSVGSERGNESRAGFSPILGKEIRLLGVELSLLTSEDEFFVECKSMVGSGLVCALQKQCVFLTATVGAFADDQPFDLVIT